MLPNSSFTLLTSCKTDVESVTGIQFIYVDPCTNIESFSWKEVQLVAFSRLGDTIFKVADGILSFQCSKIFGYTTMTKHPLNIWPLNVAHTFQTMLISVLGYISLVWMGHIFLVIGYYLLTPLFLNGKIWTISYVFVTVIHQFSGYNETVFSINNHLVFSRSPPHIITQE